MVLTDLVFPSRCAGCGAVGPSPCRDCIGRLEPLVEVEVGPPLDRCLVLMAYTEVARRLVARLKYGGVRTGVEWFAAAMADRVVAAREEPQLVTWAPAAPSNRRRRGFDQSEVLARSLAARLGVSARPLVERRGRRTQTGLSRAERLAGPALERASGADAAGRCVLVVDDVLTTGATLRGAAAVVRSAGACRVVGIAAARAVTRPTADDGVANFP